MTPASMGLFPPPSTSFAAVAGRWAGKHFFGLTIGLELPASLVFLLWLGREKAQEAQAIYSPRITRIARMIWFDGSSNVGAATMRRPFVRGCSWLQLVLQLVQLVGPRQGIALELVLQETGL